MDKKERIQVQLSSETLDFIRAETRLVGGSVSGWIRGVLMGYIGDLGVSGDAEKKSDPTGSMEDASGVASPAGSLGDKFGDWRDNVKTK